MAKRTSSRKRAKRPPLNKIRLYSTQPEKLEQALAGGDDAQWLESYFGEETYQELHRLAQEAKVRKKRGGPRVLILPGIMGSTLGRPGPLWDDVIWIDPIDVGFGKLVELALTSSRNPYRSLGVVPIAYTLLKLRLISAGYDVDYH